MGNKPFKVGIRLDQSEYESGSELSGRVYLSVSGSDDRVANGIHLTLMGEEYAEIFRQDDQNHSSSRQNSRSVDRSARHLVHLEVPLTTFPSDRIPPGQYEYPFQWILPAKLPSSMQCRNGESFCEIRYTVTAFLTQCDVRSGSSPDFSATQSLSIMDRGSGPLDKPTSIIMEPEIVPIKNCCCYSQGSMSLGFDASTTVAAPNSIVDIGITGNNMSIVQVEHLKAEWTETVTWTAHNRTETVRRILSGTKIVAGPAWNPMDPNILKRDRSYWNRPSYQTVAETISRVQGQLTLARDARDTYRGSLIEVRHSLVVTAVTPGACCITSPESSILVRVERKEPLQRPMVAATSSIASTENVYSAYGCHIDPPMAIAEILPDNWSPQEAEVLVISMTSAAIFPTNSNTRPSAPYAPDESLLKASQVSATAIGELRSALGASSNPARTLEDHFADPIIFTAIQSLSPREFVELIGSVNTDHADVARRVAQVMQPHFQCRHILAALWGLPPHVRIEVLTNVSPLAIDLEQQREMIERELDSNELQRFKAALKT